MDHFPKAYRKSPGPVGRYHLSDGPHRYWALHSPRRHSLLAKVASCPELIRATNPYATKELVFHAPDKDSQEILAQGAGQHIRMLPINQEYRACPVSNQPSILRKQTRYGLICKPDGNHRASLGMNSLE